MEHLYLNGYIKKEKIPQALHHARLHKLLAGVEDREVRSFLQGFEAVIAQRHGDFKDQIDHHEMQKIFELMRLNHNDIVNDVDLSVISAVLLNKDFQF